MVSDASLPLKTCPKGMTTAKELPPLSIQTLPPCLQLKYPINTSLNLYLQFCNNFSS